MNETTDVTANSARSAFWWAPYAVMVLIGFLAGERFGGGWGSAKDRKEEVLQALKSQVAAWNKGDLDGFMNVYWKNDQMAFCGDGQLEFGWQATYDRFLDKYFSPGKNRGKLTFDETDVLFASADGAAVRARWALAYPDGKSAGGRFVVAMRKIGGAWKIVYDHTSSHPKPAEASKDPASAKNSATSTQTEKPGVH
jgi:beta-aspartyl-peptidase (threonine type)